MDSEAVAEDFVRARLGAQALFDFPGTVPTTLNTAYAYQDRAIALWPDNVAGWKVGRIGAPWLPLRPPRPAHEIGLCHFHRGCHRCT
jgi:2-keto-4-pentenoate hydratase